MSDQTALESINANLSDPKWRMQNLYYIKDKHGKKSLFRFNSSQEALYDGLHYRNIVPKARQLGITTFFSILYLDQMLFGENLTAVIIAHTEKDVKKIFKNKIRFAFENLPEWLRKYVGETDVNTANEMTFANGCTISVALSSRGDTVNFLHVSEFGYICQKYPEKAEEIVTGAMNSVPLGGMLSIEATAKGREGYFFDYVMAAKQRRDMGRDLTALDFKLFFFPWYDAAEYRLEGHQPITKEIESYFDALRAKHGIELTVDQKRWYMKTKEVMGDKMWAEFPSTIEECFQVSTDGAYFAREMTQVYLEDRIRPLPVVDDLPVDTFWDLGWNDSNVIIFVQTSGPQMRIVDVYHNRGYKLSHYVEVLRSKGYRYGRHILPHDVEVHDLQTGKTRKQALYDLGLFNVLTAPKLPTIDGIERVRSLFSRMWFDEQRTKDLTDALGNYRKDFDAKMGQYKDSPRHDAASHFADALRTGCLLWEEEQLYANEWDRTRMAREADSQNFFS